MTDIANAAAPRRSRRAPRLPAPRSHKQILREYGIRAVVAKLKVVEYEAVSQWAKRNSIPAPYWWWLARTGIASLDELAQAVSWTP